MVKLESHRGVSTEYPENTMPAILAAIEQGYHMIEVDVDVTLDGKFVLMHDRMINRTGRDAFGNEIPEKISIREISYEDLLKYDFGIWFAKKYKGTKAPLFTDVLNAARDGGVKIKIDNKYRTFEEKDKKAFYELLIPYQDVATLTCYTVEDLKEAYGVLPEMEYHYDGFITDENLEEIKKIIPREKITVWIPFKNQATSWVKVDFVTDELAEKIKKYAKLGLWLLLLHSEYCEAERLGAEIVETNGKLKPPCQKKILCDTHTHTQNSHDGEGSVDELILAEKEKGATHLAITDHCDTFRYSQRDIITPIKNAYAEVLSAREKYPDFEVLMGLEIGEGFWLPEAAEIMTRLLPYDVILGSVHLVNKWDCNITIATRPFCDMSENEIYDYLESYFNDIITLLHFGDFDILSHLTIPLKYITGKYKYKIDLSRFMDKINYILDYIIEHGIALEVNTATYDSMGSFCPDRNILELYYSKGGYLITLGSDTHNSKRAADHFSEARELLSEIGFHNLFYYKNRKCYYYEVNN